VEFETQNGLFCVLASQAFKYFLKDGNKVNVRVITSKLPGTIYSKFESSVKHLSNMETIIKCRIKNF